MENQWPLGVVCPIPDPSSQGAFGAARTHDIHTGVDLYCPKGSEVYAVERGTVVAVVPFTGPATEPPSPWWHPTWAILVEGSEHVLCYGEVEPLVLAGEPVEPGQLIGRVLQVLKKDKGKPMTMLHFEMYTRGTNDPVWWRLGQPKPDCLLDPTPLLSRML